MPLKVKPPKAATSVVSSVPVTEVPNDQSGAVAPATPVKVVNKTPVAVFSPKQFSAVSKASKTSKATVAKPKKSDQLRGREWFLAHFENGHVKEEDVVQIRRYEDKGGFRSDESGMPGSVGYVVRTKAGTGRPIEVIDEEKGTVKEVIYGAELGLGNMKKYGGYKEAKKGSPVPASTTEIVTQADVATVTVGEVVEEAAVATAE